MRTPLPAVVIALALTSSAWAAPVDDKKDAPALKGDLAKFQGAWTAKVGPNNDVDIVVKFDGKAVNLKVTTPEGQDIELKGEFALDDAAKPHKTITWTKFTSPTGEDVPDNLGIYSVEDDDTVKTCSGGPGNARPTGFKPGEGGQQTILLKREKAKKDDSKPKAADKDEVKGDLAKFQGAWASLVGPEKNVTMTVTFKGRAITLSMAAPGGQERTMKGVIALDESVKPHKAVTTTFTRPDGGDLPATLGIYEFEGDDVLKVCNAGPGSDRPTELKAGDGGPPDLIVMKRMK